MSEPIRPKIEAEFNKNLSGEMLTNALAFVDHMDTTEGWSHMGEGVCFTVTDPGNLYIYFGHKSIVATSERDDLPVTDTLKEFVWANVNVCGYCGVDLTVCSDDDRAKIIRYNACRQGDNIIFGKKYDNLCNCPICFANPDAEMFEKIKQLAAAWKDCIAFIKEQ